jgi:hypothetical protein
MYNSMRAGHHTESRHSNSYLVCGDGWSASFVASGICAAGAETNTSMFVSLCALTPVQHFRNSILPDLFQNC